MMRTTINLNDDLVDDVIHMTNINNRSEAIRVALSSYVKMKQREKLLLLRGKVEITDSWESLRELECQ